MKLIYFLFLLVVVALSSCSEVMKDIKPRVSEPVVVVDGWLETDSAGTRIKVKVSKTQPYLDNRPNPTISGAVVQVTDGQGLTLNIPEVAERPGNYELSLTNLTVVEALNKFYTLTIAAEGETYSATSQVRRVPVIDSLGQTFTPKGLGVDTAGYFVELYGKDIPGIGDSYRFKVFKNGSQFNGPGDIVTQSDESIPLLDGIPFIPPIRFGINPILYQPGDSVTVEILSITRDAFDFFNELEIQIQNGGLFSQPVANVRTNVKNSNLKGKAAVGYFGCSAVSTKSIVIKAE